MESQGSPEEPARAWPWVVAAMLFLIACYLIGLFGVRLGPH